MNDSVFELFFRILKITYWSEEFKSFPQPIQNTAVALVTCKKLKVGPIGKDTTYIRHMNQRFTAQSDLKVFIRFSIHSA